MTSTPARRASTFSESMIVKTYGGSWVMRRNSMPPTVFDGRRPSRELPGSRRRRRRRRPVTAARRSAPASGADGSGSPSRSGRPSGGGPGPAPGCGRPARVGASSSSPASARPPPITTTSGSSRFTRLARPSPTHQANWLQHGQGLGVALQGGAGDVLAAHVVGRPAGQGDHPVGPPGLGGVAGQAAQAAARRRTAPSSPGARTGTAARSGRRPCGPARRRTRPPRAPAAPGHDAAADAGAEGDQDQVVGRGRRRPGGARPSAAQLASLSTTTGTDHRSARAGPGSRSTAAGRLGA